MPIQFNTRNLIMFSSFIGILFYLFLVEKSDFLYIQYDSYYYAAVADSYSETGEWKNQVTIPPSNLVTPQNGIVIIHVLLNMLGIDDINVRLKLLTILNMILLIAMTVACFNIFKKIRIDNTASWILSLSIPVTFYYHMVLLQAINDMIFITLCYLTLIYIFNKKLTLKNILVLTLLAFIIPQFRLVGFLVFLAPAASSLFLKQYRNTVIFSGLTGFCIISPFIFNFLIGFQLEDISNRSSGILNSYDTTFFISHLFKTFSLSIPEAFLRITYFTSGFTISNQWIGFIISTFLCLVFFRSVKQYWQEKNEPYIIILLFLFFNIIFFQLFPAQPTRYIINISPFIPALLFLTKNIQTQQKIAILILSFTFIISISGILVTEKPAEAQQKKIFSEYILNYTKDSEYSLLSYLPRVSYFLLQKRASKTIEHAINTKKKYILVIGPQKYQNYVAYKILKMNIPIAITQLPTTYTGYVRTKVKVFGFDYESQTIYANKMVLNK